MHTDRSPRALTPDRPAGPRGTPAIGSDATATERARAADPGAAGARGARVVPREGRRTVVPAEVGADECAATLRRVGAGKLAASGRRPAGGGAGAGG